MHRSRPRDGGGRARRAAARASRGGRAEGNLGKRERPKKKTKLRQVDMGKGLAVVAWRRRRPCWWGRQTVLGWEGPTFV